MILSVSEEVDRYEGDHGKLPRVNPKFTSLSKLDFNVRLNPPLLDMPAYHSFLYSVS